MQTSWNRILKLWQRRLTGTGRRRLGAGLAPAAEQLEARQVPTTAGMVDGVLHITAEPGEVNRVSVRVTGGNVHVTDAAGFSAVDGATQVSRNHIRFDRSVEFQLNLGDQNDHLSVNSGVGVFYRAFGGDGDDVMIGGSGQDQLIGDAGDDLLEGRGANDKLSGGDGNDTLHGDEGEDFVAGDAGNDLITTAGGTDTVEAGDGDDTVDAGAGADWVTAGPGFDIVRGGAGNDFITGDEQDDTLIGGAGDDVLDGGVGDDVLDGNDGNDVLNGYSGFDTLFGGRGQDSLFGGSGDDDLYGGRGNDNLIGDVPVAPDQSVMYDVLPDCGVFLGEEMIQPRTSVYALFLEPVAGMMPGDVGYPNGSDWMAGEEGNDFVYGGVGHSDIAFQGRGADTIQDVEIIVDKGAIDQLFAADAAVRRKLNELINTTNENRDPTPLAVGTILFGEAGLPTSSSELRMQCQNNLRTTTSLPEQGPGIGGPGSTGI